MTYLIKDLSKNLINARIENSHDFKKGHIDIETEVYKLKK
jgi:hypothetical protein